MKRYIVLAGLFGGALAGEACSGPSEQSDGGSDAQPDTTQHDVVTNDVVTNDVVNDVMMDAGCPTSWTELPDAGGVLPVPDGGGGVLIHAAGSGAQNYTCEATDAGTYVWTFVGPQATLSDCEANVIGHHFASEAGATAPEWQTTDMSYVIGKKIAAFDAGASSVPWLLLQSTSSGGSGTIAKTLYVQRLFTNGGQAPTSTCDNTTVGNTVMQPYTADYYFYGN